MRLWASDTEVLTAMATVLRRMVSFPLGRMVTATEMRTTSEHELVTQMKVCIDQGTWLTMVMSRMELQLRTRARGRSNGMLCNPCHRRRTCKAML